jgi:hypothetical protein
MTLAQLASNEPITPVRLLQPATEEELMDELAMQQNAGADDSEDEEEDEVAEANGLAATAASAEWDRAAHAADDEVMQTFLLDDLFGPPAINLDEVAFDAAVDIPGAPPGWKRPCAPDDWKRAKVRIEKGEPESFDNIDNPGDWDEFVFRPKFQTKKGKDYGRYMYHALPTGATVVPKNELGKRVVGDWEFHYNGYTNTGSQFRNGATKDHVFPECRQGSLNAAVLSRLGLTVERMRGSDGLPDALFFYQLLLPIHDTKKTVPNDPRRGFYQEVATWSLLYTVGELQLLTSGYGTYSRPATYSEFLQWDGSIVMDSVLGGSQGAFFRRFDPMDTGYSKHIAEAFSKERWHGIKRVYKLNNNKESPKRGEPQYNPAYKYHYVYETLIFNLNSITFKADDDQCIDETTFPFNGFGEPGASLISKIMNKPGVKASGIHPQTSTPS